jgi:hypothetical protein
MDTLRFLCMSNARGGGAIENHIEAGSGLIDIKEREKGASESIIMLI